MEDPDKNAPNGSQRAASAVDSNVGSNVIENGGETEKPLPKAELSMRVPVCVFPGITGRATPESVQIRGFRLMGKRDAPMRDSIPQLVRYVCMYDKFALSTGNLRLCMYVFMYVCACVCVGVCLHMHMHIHTHILQGI
jgi:hypothetical protein